MKKYLSIILAISVILSSFVCVMPAFAYANPDSDTDLGITYLWNDDFSSVDSLVNYTTGNTGAGSAVYNKETQTMYSSSSATYSLTDEGTLKITNTGNAYDYIWTPYVYNNAGGQLVFSYDIKFDKTGKYFRGGGRFDYGSDHVFVNYDNKIFAYSSTGNVSTKTYTTGTWMNVTVVYNDANTGTTDAPAYYKDIYINGEYYCTLDNKTSDTSAYTYRGAGTRTRFVFCNYDAGSSLELDNLKVYALPSELKYKVKSISPESAVLEFNAIPTEYEGSDFEILNADGTTAATTVSSATLSTTNPREVTINFANTLSASTDYIIKPSGVKAGTASGDICTDLSVSSSDTGVTVTTGRLDNSVYSDVIELLEQDFENVDSTYTTTVSKVNGEGINSNSGSTLSIETIDGTKALRMTQDAITPMTRFILRNDYIPDDTIGTTVVVEYRVRADFSDNANAMFDARNGGGGYGPHLPSIHNGGIYDNAVLSNKKANYTNNEWVTLTSVFKLSSDGTKVSRDTYINGVYNSTYEADYVQADYGFLYGTQNLSLSFRVRDAYGKADTNGIVDIDYIRAYRVPASYTFGAEIVSDKTDCDVDSVTVKFNNLVDTNSLSNAKITLKDSSDTVANVLYIEPVIEANATGYALKAKLVFDKSLDFNTEYDLYLDNVADTYGNKLIFKDTITTCSNKITSFTITNNTANIEMTASDKDLTLVIAAYSVTDGVEKMEGIATVTITAGTTTGEVSLTNVPDGAEVRAYLLDGFKPIAIK